MRKINVRIAICLNSLSGFSAVTPQPGDLGYSRREVCRVSIPCRVSRLLRLMIQLRQYQQECLDGLNSLSGFSAVTPMERDLASRAGDDLASLNSLSGFSAVTPGDDAATPTSPRASEGLNSLSGFSAVTPR